VPLRLLLDSNILARFVRPEIDENRPVAEAILRLLNDPDVEIFVPEIIDYELRRKLLHLATQRHQGRKWARDALTLLDKLAVTGYLPLTTDTMKLAADLWAQTRVQGRQRCHEDSLDIDIILAAQAKQVGGQVVTMNEKHFRGLVQVFDWRSQPGNPLPEPSQRRSRQGGRRVSRSRSLRKTTP
jgi:predicted nucleic acid-binding protein